MCPTTAVRGLVVCLAVAACAPLTTIGTDARWLAALGRAVVRARAIPDAVPYASLPTGGWHDAPALGQVVFYALERGLGDRGLVAAQCAAVAIALAALARETPTEASLVLLLVPIAAADAFLVARAQLFSLALFPLLLVLLRGEARAPSARIWLLPPLLALWANLHGGVLVGLAVAAVYVAVDRVWTEPATGLAVALASAAAVCATPAGIHSVAYYRGVLGNVWRTSHLGLWAPPSPHRPLDVLCVAAVLVLAAAAVRGRPRPWELIAGAALAFGAAQAARNEVWLVLFLAFAASRGLRSLPAPPRRARIAGAALALVAGSAGVAIAAERPPARPGAVAAVRVQAMAAAHGRPILAPPYEAEQLALAGARVVIGNPVDAFSRRDQRRYLNWLEGGPAPRAPVVLAVRGTLPQLRLARDPRFCRAAADASDVVYLRCNGTT